MHKVGQIFCTDADVSKYYCNKPAIPTKQEQEMAVEPTQTIQPSTVANIESIVLIQGKDASKMTDESIFAFIRTLEDTIANYEGVQNKPKKLIAKISQLKEDIQALVSYVDGRE